jgi:beta-phosphoglucomutase-like phosphatase (HAD superfamily)
MALRALLFDFDGLIVDTETPSFASWQQLYREHGEELTLEQWSKAIGTIGGFDPVAHLQELAGPLELEDALARRLTHELALVEVEQLRPGVLDQIEEAKRRGLAVAIVSSSSRPWIDGHLARLERAELLGLAPEEAIAFEDSPNGVRAAKAAGLVCVAVPNGVTAALGLDEADLVVDSLAALPFDRLLELASDT